MSSLSSARRTQVRSKFEEQCPVLTSSQQSWKSECQSVPVSDQSSFSSVGIGYQQVRRVGTIPSTDDNISNDFDVNLYWIEY